MSDVRKSRIAWLLFALLFIVVGFVLLLIEGKEDDDDSRKKKSKLGTVGTIGSVFIFFANIIWFILLLSVIIDKSPIHLAAAMTARK
jgi:hypothetical protein